MFAVAELNGHLDLKSKYIYTNGMLVGKITSDNELYQYFHDGLGSITMIIDSTGQYQNLYTYDDFGDFRKKDEEVSNSYCYTGQERDEEPSGLYNLRARYYASGMGRFTQEDPIDYDWGRPQRMNLYAYVMNDPLNRVDPLGLVCHPITPRLSCGGWQKVSESVKEDVPWLFVPGASSYEGGDIAFNYVITCVWYRELPVQEKFRKEWQQLLACTGRCGTYIKKETSIAEKSRIIMRRQTRLYTTTMHTDVIFEIEVCKSLPELHP